MKNIFSALWVVFFASLSFAAGDGLYKLDVKTIDGKSTKLADYKGKIILFVNVASQCGYTSQYTNLEKLYQKYKKKNFVVLGFPSNDFGGQEPGSNEEIAKFCKLNYDVSFPLFDKAPVSGEKVQPVYSYLLANLPSEFKGPVKWNFEKILVSQKGDLIARWRSRTDPLDTEIAAQIDQLLK